MQRGKAYEYYECYSRMSHKTMAKAKRCTNKIWRKADLEEEIWNVLEELEYEDIKTEEPDLIKPKEKELKTVEKQIEKLMDLYLIDGIPQDTLVTRLNALNQKKETLLEEITTLKNKSHKMTATEFKNQKSKLGSIKNADLETQRAFIGSLIESITLLPGHDLKIKWRF
jgi:site-specific DNA recombinase